MSGERMAPSSLDEMTPEQIEIHNNATLMEGEAPKTRIENASHAELIAPIEKKQREKDRDMEAEDPEYFGQLKKLKSLYDINKEELQPEAIEEALHVLESSNVNEVSPEASQAAWESKEKALIIIRNSIKQLLEQKQMQSPYTDFTANLEQNLRSEEVEKEFGNYHKFTSYHILIGSSTDRASCPYFDFPGDYSVTRFLVNWYQELAKATDLNNS